MTLELITIAGSPYGWRVQLALEHKGIPYRVRTLSLSAGELRTPAYLALNPRGRVPTLVDGDFTLSESLAILAYLEARWPEPPLLGTAPRDTGRIWRAIAEYTAYLDAAVEDFILPLYFGRAADEADKVRAAAATIADELARYEAQLAAAPFLAGDELTAADLVVFPHVQSVLRAAGKDAARDLELPFLPLPPALAAWRARLETLPYYPRTIPPNWA